LSTAVRTGRMYAAFTATPRSGPDEVLSSLIGEERAQVKPGRATGNQSISRVYAHWMARV
jgi:hypothetical protein